MFNFTGRLSFSSIRWNWHIFGSNGKRRNSTNERDEDGMGSLCSCQDRYCCVIYVEQYLFPFVFIAYILAFSCYIETYYFVHLDIALPTGSAGLKAWKQKYSLSVAPSWREFYELMLSIFHALAYIFISVAYLFQSIFIHHLVMCHICTTTSSDY